MPAYSALLLSVFCFCLGFSFSCGTKIATYQCDSTISFDSLYFQEGGWTWTFVPDNDKMKVGPIDLTESQRRAVASLVGPLPAYLLLMFKLSHTFVDAIQHPNCRFHWDPRNDASATATFRAAHIGMVPLEGTIDGCRVSISTAQSRKENITDSMLWRLTPFISPSSGITALSTLSFSLAGDDLDEAVFPLEFKVTPGCSPTLILIGERFGDIAPWYVWAFMSAYLLIVLGINLLYGKQWMLSPGTATTLFSLNYVGFFAATIAVALELSIWQDPSSSFPFPWSVVYFLCCALVFCALFVWLFWSHPFRMTLSSCVLRLMVFALSAAFTVGFWARGFVILGVISTTHLFLSNALAVYHYIQFISELPEEHSLSNSPCLLVLLWFPVTLPFAPLGIVYSEILISTGAQLKMSDAVRLFDILFGLRFSLVHFLPMLILSGVGAAYHGPFVPLFQAHCAVGFWLLILSVKRYAAERRRLKVEHESGSLWGPIRSLLSKYSNGSPSKVETHSVVPPGYHSNASLHADSAKRGRPPTELSFGHFSQYMANPPNPPPRPGSSITPPRSTDGSAIQIE